MGSSRGSAERGGGRGRRAGPRRRAAARSGAAAPAPAGPGRAAEFRNLPGRGGQAGTWQHGGEEGLGAGEGWGGHGAADSLVGLLAVGIASRGEDGDCDGGICQTLCRCLSVFERLATKVFNAGGIYTFHVL